MKRLIDAFCSGFKIREMISVTEWAERYRKLTMSAIKGNYNAQRTPYFIEIMNELGEDKITQKVIVMASAQLGKTESGNNFLGYVIDRMGGYFLIVQPTQEEARKFNNLRVSPMIDDNDFLKSKFIKVKADGTDGKPTNNTLQRDYIGGSIVFGNAGSPNSMSSLPVRFLFLDEIDRYRIDNKNGHPYDLALKRTETFSNKKVFSISTPTLKQTSKIYEEYLKGDQRHFYMTCPHCKYDKLEFTRELFKYEHKDGVITDAFFNCPLCGKKIEEKDKAKLIQNAKWIATAKSTDPKLKSYYINQAYSLISSGGWREIAKEELETEKTNEREKRQKLMNLTWGLPFDDEIKEQTGEFLYEKYIQLNDNYDTNKINDNIGYINLTIDTQDDRFVFLITAYAQNGERYVLDFGDLLFSGDLDEGFQQIETLSNRKYFFKNDENSYLGIESILIDTGGHYTQDIYNFVQKKNEIDNDNRYQGIKGQNRGRIMEKSKNIYFKTNKNGKPLNNSRSLFLINVSLAKTSILESLSFNIENEKKWKFIHINPFVFNIEFFLQATSERRVIRADKNIAFEKIRDRNEALDLLAYSYADAFRNNIINSSDDIFENIKKRNIRKINETFTNNENKTERRIKKVNLDELF